jgi:hypothetical protein
MVMQLGFPLLLPATDFIVVHGGEEDPFAALGGSRVLFSIMRDSLSPLHLYAIGATPARVRRSARRVANAVPIPSV